MPSWKRDVIWYGMLDADRNMRYFQIKSAEQNKKGRWVRAIIFLASFTGIVTLLYQLHWSFQFLLTVIIGVCTYIDMFQDPAKSSILLHQLGNDYKNLEGEWRHLWEAVESGKYEEIEKELEKEIELLNQRDIAIDRQLGFISIELDNDLNEKCADETYKVISNEFNTKYQEPKKGNSTSSLSPSSST